jgi:hypothetical protein
MQELAFLRVLLFGHWKRWRRWFGFLGFVEAQELCFAIEELDQDLAGFHSGFQGFDRDDL